MAAGSTYTPIATQTLSSAQSSVTFSSISGSYTDLVLVCAWKAATTNNSTILLTFNGVGSGGVYSGTQLYGNGSTVGSARNTNADFISIARAVGAPAVIGDTGTYIINCQNYSNTTTFKSVLARASSADSGTEADVGLWRSTSAITSITLQADTSGIAIGSTFTLYGILAA
jgi:hypothetical protein